MPPLAGSDVPYGVLTSAGGNEEVAIPKVAGAVTVTVAEACADAVARCVLFFHSGAEVVAASPVAVIVIVVLPATAGAVNNPLLEIVPALADQVTAVLAVPLTRAVNCNCSSDVRVALSGVRESALEGFSAVAAEGLDVAVCCTRCSRT